MHRGRKTPHSGSQTTSTRLSNLDRQHNTGSLRKDVSCQVSTATTAPARSGEGCTTAISLTEADQSVFMAVSKHF